MHLPTFKPQSFYQVASPCKEMWLWTMVQIGVYENRDFLWFSCKGTRASVASSVCSLSLIQLVAIWWNPFQKKEGWVQDRGRELCFHCCWREKLIPLHTQTPHHPINTHTDIYNHPHKSNDCYSSPPIFSAFIRVPQSFITL